MTTNNRIKVLFSGHRIIIMVILCLFGLSVVQSRQANKKKRRQSTNERIYLVHADVATYDMFGNNPTAQVLKGRVAFRHKGAVFSVTVLICIRSQIRLRRLGMLRCIRATPSRCSVIMLIMTVTTKWQRHAITLC